MNTTTEMGNFTTSSTEHLNMTNDVSQESISNEPYENTTSEDCDVFSHQKLDTTTVQSIAVLATTIALVEFVIIMVLLRRFWHSKCNLKGVHILEKQEECCELGIVNKVYKYSYHNEHDAVTEKKTSSLLETKTNDNTGKTGCNKTQRRDPGYIDIDLTADIPIESENVGHHTNMKETEFFDKTYSHIEASPMFSLATDGSSYSHIKRNNDDNTQDQTDTNRCTIIKGQKSYIRTDDDTEYDHAVYRKGHQSIADNKTYSRISCVVPRQNPSFRVKQTSVDVTAEKPYNWYDDTVIQEAENCSTGLSEKYCEKSDESERIKLEENSICKNEQTSYHKYKYSVVKKQDIRVRQQPKSSSVKRKETDGSSKHLKHREYTEVKIQSKDLAATESTSSITDLNIQQPLKHIVVMNDSTNETHQLPESAIDSTGKALPQIQLTNESSVLKTEESCANSNKSKISEISGGTKGNATGPHYKYSKVRKKSTILINQRISTTDCSDKVTVQKPLGKTSLSLNSENKIVITEARKTVEVPDDVDTETSDHAAGDKDFLIDPEDQSHEYINIMKV
ncbi:uncharacterized protein LOC128556369 isoform X2 [Mercenaria mercenaria]|nr:uncharacterized protein LOC128556369 isoform X2 [Mercenaria mercenaria]XP_053397234.1 uncharacterized protein LOC128556369 isoform X2 [Mercenaria mercenaria]